MDAAKVGELMAHTQLVLCPLAATTLKLHACQARPPDLMLSTGAKSSVCGPSTAHALPQGARTHMATACSVGDQLNSFTTVWKAAALACANLRAKIGRPASGRSLRTPAPLGTLAACYRGLALGTACPQQRHCWYCVLPYAEIRVHADAGGGQLRPCVAVPGQGA